MKFSKTMNGMLHKSACAIRVCYHIMDCTEIL